jgi:hypothetical protein
MLHCLTLVLVFAVFGQEASAEENPPNVLFEERFEGKIDESWTWLREDSDAWRIRDGALEIRAQPGDASTVKNALVREAPRRRKGHSYAIEVTVTNLAPPTEQYEQLGITWYHDGKPALKYVKERIDGALYVHPDKAPLKENTVHLRLVVAGNKVVGQFHTDAKENFQTTFAAELPPPGEKDEISLQTYHGPADAEHWMRFDDFRVVEIRE